MSFVFFRFQRDLVVVLCLSGLQQSVSDGNAPQQAGMDGLRAHPLDRPDALWTALRDELHLHNGMLLPLVVLPLAKHPFRPGPY